MATKGYSSYHGRGSGCKTGLIILLVLILLAAVAFLLSQRYLVYDETGKAHWELPFSRPSEPTPEQPENNPFEDTDDTAVLALNKAGVINGMTETTFEPTGILTRAQIAKIIWILRDLK